MRIQDLLLVVVFFILLGLVLAGLVALFRRRAGQAKRQFLHAGVFLAVYVAAVGAAGLMSSRRWIALGADQCFDDWCAAVETVQHATELGGAKAGGEFWIVGLRLSNHGRGRAQAALDAHVTLESPDAREFAPSPAGQRAWEFVHGESIPLSVRITAGDTVRTTRVFDVPAGLDDLGLRVIHGEFPGRIILGDSNSLFHKHTLVRLEPPGS